MTTQPIAPARSEPSERPVFAATSDARPRALRFAGRFAAGLVGLWLVALVMGAFGFGHVPGIQLPQIVGDRGDSKSASSKLKRSKQKATPKSLTGADRSPGLTAQRAAAERAGRRDGSGVGSPPSATRGPSSGGGAGTRGRGGAQAPAGSSTPIATPAPATSSPAPQASPTAGTTPAATHTHSTPPRSSSDAPGSRSQAGTAPGRDNSSASPTPGAGNPERGNPHG